MKSVLNRIGLSALLFFFLVNSSSHAISLFDDSQYRALIADKKAYLVGDQLTVIVMETSNAQTSADLGSAKAIKMAVSAGYNQTKHEAGLSLAGEGHSRAKTDRHGKIKAALTVEIKALLPNNNYQVEGHQQIQINGEEQTILLSGRVRGEDISAQNTILSTRLANAQISYTGQGSVSNSQRRNPIYQFLAYLGLV